jgi:hypothetical protein
LLQERYADPEVQGGKIALIAVKQIRVQKPPNGLDRMRTTFLKQVAYNQRVLEAEHEIAGINCDIADFLSGMSLDPADQVVICVNGLEPMKRGEEAVGGQLWMQGDRRMTVSNTVLDGMENTKEAAILFAAAEAVTWRNAALELSEHRKGQRVVIYPKELTGLREALSTGNPNIGEEDGHPIAYAQIIQESQKFERPPLFLRADCEQIVEDPVWAEKVPEWPCTAERVATGGRRRVLQDGPDTWNSDDVAEADIEADKEVNMYTAEMDPKLGPKVLSQSEAARQRAAGKAMKSVKQPPRPQTPGAGSSDDDDPNGSATVWSQSRQCFRSNKHRKSSSSTESDTDSNASPDANPI